MDISIIIGGTIVFSGVLAAIAWLFLNFFKKEK